MYSCVLDHDGTVRNVNEHDLDPHCLSSWSPVELFSRPFPGFLWIRWECLEELTYMQLKTFICIAKRDIRIIAIHQKPCEIEHTTLDNQNQYMLMVDASIEQESEQENENDQWNGILRILRLFARYVFIFLMVLLANASTVWVKKRFKSVSVSMPWSIPPALLVLWSVVWMFISTQEENQRQLYSTLGFEPDWGIYSVNPHHSYGSEMERVFSNIRDGLNQSPSHGAGNAIGASGGDGDQVPSRENQPRRHEKRVICDLCKFKISRSNIAKHRNNSVCKRRQQELASATNEFIDAAVADNRSRHSSPTPAGTAGEVSPGILGAGQANRAKKRQRDVSTSSGNTSPEDEVQAAQDPTRIEHIVAEERRRRKEAEARCEQAEKRLQDERQRNQTLLTSVNTLSEAVKSLTEMLNKSSENRQIG
ncbi:hypothetical protein F5Y19DRAFT_369913 [Xylariaceae sp. FL1651]|nr:hypothetical protein F5Y19DRAFT_369913 [Xylariaceae sp. FL1651]